MKCPICESGLKITDYHNDHIIMESDSECTTCERYSEHFAYGSTEAGVKLDTGWKVWQWDCKTGPQERGRINLEMGRIVKVAHGEWRESQ